MRRSGRGTGAAITTSFALIAAACSGDPVVSTASIEMAPIESAGVTTTVVDAVPTATNSTSIPASIAAEPAAPASTIGGIPPPDVPFPAGALPILRTYEFAQPVTSPIGFDDEIVVNHGVGLARVDVDTGEIITATLPSPDEVKAEVFYAVTDGSSYVAVLDVAGQGTIDTTVAIDPQTLRRTGRSERLGRRTNLPLFTSGPSPRLMLAKTSDGIVPFDPTTLEEGEPLLAGDFVDVRGHTDRGELWTWDRTGTVRVFDRAGTELASIELDRAIPMFGSAAVLVTATSVWIADGDHGSLVRIERDSKLPTHEMSLLDHYEWADVIRFRFSDRDAPFLIANVSVGDEGWWMLVGVDPETGEVTSSHVIAPDTFEYGWNAFDAPALSTVGDRLFVLDHRRRIVEVDVTALSEPSLEPWTDPGLGRSPILDDQEAVIADLTRRFLGGEEVGFTEPAGAAIALDAIGEPAGVGDWEVYGVDVDGDRAWSRAGPVAEDVGGFFVFERVDGAWLVSAAGLCALAFASQDPCR